MFQIIFVLFVGDNQVKKSDKIKCQQNAASNHHPKHVARLQRSKALILFQVLVAIRENICNFTLKIN